LFTGLVKIKEYISRSNNSEAAGAAEYNFTPPIDGGAKRQRIYITYVPITAELCKLLLKHTHMKQLLTALIIVCFTSSLLAQHSLENIWQTDTMLKNPESVRYDATAKLLYVTNIGVFDKDGTGSISKVGLDGKMISKDWITGLSAPKGIGVYKNKMYVAEQSTVAIIDMAKGSVSERIKIDGAEMLNDVTIDSKGIVYVSDTKKGKVHKIENGKPSLYLDNLKDVNGLLSVGSDLYILADQKLQKADASRKLTFITDGIEGGADGIEMVSDHEFIVTGWEGIVYCVKDDGSKQTLLDSREKKINTADLGYDPVTKTAYIPAMLNNKVFAFTFK